MSAVFNLLALRHAYRNEVSAGGSVGDQAQRHLEAAGDALTLALLTLSGPSAGDAGDERGRVEQGRSFLVEAVTELSRARLYLPGIRSQSVAVVMQTHAHTPSELARLHRLATRLLWQNHAHLPARLQAKPLEPEEEAQLAVVFAGLARDARIDRALRYKWAGLSAIFGGLGLSLGFPVIGVMAVSGAVALAGWRAAKERGGEPAPSA